MARAPIMAAGGIVLRREQPPRIAVVRLRKRDEWVLPKGKLDDGETPRDAAKREVLEETGHKVTVHEFLGTLVVDTGTRSKVVHYWRMEAADEPSQPLMDDVRAVDWLLLDAAVARLSRDHERTFLEMVGPYALAGLIRKTRAKPAPEVARTVEKTPAAAEKIVAEKAAVAEKSAVAKKRRSRVSEPPAPPAEIAVVTAAEHDAPAPEIAPTPAVAATAAAPEARPDRSETEALSEVGATIAPQPAEAERVPEDVERVEAVVAAIKSLVPDHPATRGGAAGAVPTRETGSSEPQPSDADREAADDPVGNGTSAGEPRLTLAQKMRAWLGRAA
ncbi:NUDIX hydrolase [Bradyrhizobium sp. SZCCHNRI20481]|uniref:NUDIX hydrolase n=1 Tax=Bradyrhizobium sp. SZCCHNRI20481 TaxID=3057286 RepID=UPI002916B924|nr:NUDIX hydrolase [Bradyrhizobium sp. SZCCHNRI20481]